MIAKRSIRKAKEASLDQERGQEPESRREVFLCGDRKNETPDELRSLPSEPKNPCPRGQVFHRRYRENRAKMEAKIHIALKLVSLKDYAVRG